MKTALSNREGKQVAHRPPASVLAMALLLFLLVAGALQGGLAMVSNPIDPLGMSLDFLSDTPVDDYFWPGMFLLGISAASAITVAGLIFPWRWAWARSIEAGIGYRWPWIGAMATGIILLAFEVIELFVVPFHPVMHPLLIVVSLAIVALASTPSARRHLLADCGD